MDYNWHEGEGAAYFRCMLCGRPVSEKTIENEGGCSHCGGRRVKPTSLTFWEKVFEIIKHPSLLKGLFDAV
jgi:DNA-directed RNA polymerase subunit RPC12/RpoP